MKETDELLKEKITKRSYNYVTGNTLRSLMAKMKSNRKDSGFKNIESWIDVVELDFEYPPDDFYDHQVRFAHKQYYNVILYFKKIESL